MMNRCPQRHPFEGKICRECGYILPLERGAKIGPFQVSECLISRRDANLYLIEQDDKILALWEFRELYQASHRQKLMVALQDAPANLLPVISYFVDDAVDAGPIAYFIQSGDYFHRGTDLNAFIQEQGFLEPEFIHALILNLLDVLIFLEAHDFCLNGFSSPMIQILDGQAYLSFPFYGDLLNNSRVLALRTLHGFTPPEGQRTGLLFRETDRFGLAMILFHCLTGLSPTFWAPDVPTLSRYKYIWDKPVLAFFEMLMTSFGEHSAQSLKDAWMALKLQPKRSDSVFAQENKVFYQAIELVALGKSQSALDLLAGIQESQLHNPHITALMADIFVDQQKKSAAAYYYGESIRREKLGGTYLKLGRFYMAEGQLKRAARAFDFSLAFIPYDPEPYWQMAEIALIEAQSHRASRWIEKSQKVKPTQRSREINNRIQQALQPGSSKKNTKDGFSFRFDRWDQQFQNRQKQRKYTCPQGHPQTMDVLNCQVCGRVMHLEPGEKIQVYQIEQVITSRDLKKKHNSSTYLALNPDGERVIVKEIYQVSSGLERYERELRALSALKHAAIPALHSSFEHNQRLYLVQEYRTGDNLDDLVRKEGCLEEAEVRLIANEALNLIVYLQSLNIVHADFKPKNMLWERDKQQFTLLDFDVSVFLEEGQGIGRTPGATAHFAAPEQKDNYIVSLQTDAFSLALSLVYLLTGFTPELFYYAFPKRAYRKWNAYLQIHPIFERFLSDVLIFNTKKRIYQKSEDLLARWQRVLSAPLLQANLVPQQDLVKMYYLFHKSFDLADLQDYAKQIIRLRPDAKMHYLIAHELLDKGYAQHAKAFYRGAITLDTEWPFAYWELAEIYTRDKNLGLAMDTLKNALKETGHIAFTLIELGHVYRQTKLWREAINMFEEALNLEPRNTKALLGKAHVLILLQLFNEAEKTCEKVLSYEAENPRAYHLMHMISGMRKDYTKAIEFGQRAALLEPENALMLFDLGMTYYRANRFSEAVKVLQDCLYRAPQLSDGHFFLGSAYLMLGQHEAAETHLQTALKAGQQTKKQTIAIQQKLDVIQQIRERLIAATN